MQRTVRFRLNGRDTAIDTDDRRMLVWVLIRELELDQTKFGCGSGRCGACTVLVDGVAVRSCLSQVTEVEGRDLVTIEGLAERESLRILAEEMSQHGVLACDFCAPGMIFNAHSLLLEYPSPSREQILSHIDRSICQCGATAGIVEAIRSASTRLELR